MHRDPDPPPAPTGSDPASVPDPVFGPDDPDTIAARLETDLVGVVDAPPKPRRWWVLPLRIAVSAAMLWYLIHQLAGVSLADLVPEWSAQVGAWSAIALALTAAGVVLSAARWRQVLAGMRVPNRFGHLVSWYFAGQFVSNVLPTTIGGDVLRISRLARETGDAADSFASVTIERLTGWLVLPLLTFIGFALDPELLEVDHRSTLALVIAAGTLVTLLAIGIVAVHPRLGGRFADRQGWRRFLGAVHLGVTKLRRSPRAAAEVVAVGMAYQFVLVLAAAAAARALGIDGVGVGVLLAFYPAVLIAQVLPVGISGVGVRELAFVTFLGPLGVPESQAIALGLSLFALNLIVSLAGAPAFVRAPPRHPDHPDVAPSGPTTSPR